MEHESYPWRTNTDLAGILDRARHVFASLGVIEPTGGCTEAEIAAMERRILRPLPPDVREFYRGMRPTDVFAHDSTRAFGFYPISSPELTWKSMKGAEPPEDWTAAQGLALGQSRYGDPFWWVEGHRLLADGSIVLLDHESALGEDVMFVHFARSFREFIGKVAYFKDLFAPPADALFRREYVELNPTVRK